MGIQLTFDKGRVPVKVWTKDIEHEALQQLVNVSQLAIVHGHVAAMPDVHAGIGATVGSVIPTKGAIIPAAVGVDIGCGMNALRLSVQASELPDNLHRIRSAIEAAVPVGFSQHEASKVKGSQHARTARVLDQRLDAVVAKHPGLTKMQKRFNETWVCQLGTLGGGNHFIEVCLDEDQHVWVMLHSGSRGIGNVMGRYFIEAARKELMRNRVNLPDRDLAYFAEGSAWFDDYVEAVEWAQDYALLNRREMMRLVLEVLQRELSSSIGAWKVEGEAINCHHNCVARETHFGENVFVTRKGAISAREGEMGIIPGSMGKDIDEVMENQRDLVEVVHTLKQVVCVKG